MHTSYVRVDLFLLNEGKRLARRGRLVADEDLIRRIWGRYLQDVSKYDKWGALGKILLIEEVLREEGPTSTKGPEDPGEYEVLANELFPRTFYCERPVSARPGLGVLVKKYFSDMKARLLEGGVDRSRVRAVALEETAEHFCLAIADVETILNH